VHGIGKRPATGATTKQEKRNGKKTRKKNDQNLGVCSVVVPDGAVKRLSGARKKPA
jgi:hypothetical protein